FFDMNGYDTSMVGGGEDWDLPLRMKKSGYKIVRVKSLINHNEGRLTLIKTLKKKYYYAQTFKYYIKKHSEMAKKQLVPLRAAYFRNWKKFLKHPLCGLALLFMKLCEAVAAFMGYISSKR
ncbi:MAG: glycosyltransferase family 2 protein, partial [Candidatus Odinarchaeia archaeon]